MAGSGAYAANLLTVDLGNDAVIHAKTWRYTAGQHLVDVTNEDSNNTDEFVGGLQMAITGSAEGHCDETSQPTAPSTAVSASLFDGKHTKAFNALISEMEVTATIDAGCDVSFNYTESQA